MRAHPGTVWLERGLLAAGLACLTWWAAGAAYAGWASAGASRRLDRLIASAPLPPGRPVAPQTGDPLGRISIPRVGVATVVVEGDDDLTLSFAAGHIPGTALPGEPGNAGLAGHRDGVFRGLARIRRGDLVSLTTPAGTFRYTVESLRVVEPEDTAVLHPTRRPTLTLVTCYPFHYIGPAPKRFVVRAVLVGPAAESSAEPVPRPAGGG
jgi:sortase A